MSKSDSACRRCQHWRPLFTGEAWGVRSFADAPAADREAILARLCDFMERNRYSDPEEVLSGHAGISERARRSSEGVPDWPMWGECALTDLNGDEGPSLARAIDGSRYQAILRCHADFGCVQFLEVAISPTAAGS